MRGTAVDRFFKLINKYGREYTLKRPVLGELIDPLHPSMGRVKMPPELYPVIGREDVYDTEIISKSDGLIKNTDVLMFMSAKGLSVTPSSSDIILDDVVGEEYSIENSSAYRSIDSDVVFYELQLRG